MTFVAFTCYNQGHEDNTTRLDRQAKAMRSRGKAATVIALYTVKDKLDPSNKGELSRRLGISRWTLDRYLATINELDQTIQELITKLEG